jgi:hypothetical protein
MKPWSIFGFAALIACSLVPPCAAQCGFAIVPAAEQRWYREEGWPIPGLSDAKGFANMDVKLDGTLFNWGWPEGVTVSWVVHDEGYNVQFPDAVFDDNGSRKRMLPRKFLLYEMLRWEMNGTPYAYTYELGPYDFFCAATVDIIDDRGDGKFRLMTSPGHVVLGVRTMRWPKAEAPPVPDWLRKPKS